MKKPLISVIIPVYNTELYLERCLKTVTENTYKNLEIICVNDGSTDHSLDILKQLAVQDSRIRVIDQPNGGVSAARNHGLDVASGEYIAFIDSDDWVNRYYFEDLLNIIEDYSADVASVGRNLTYDQDYGTKDMLNHSAFEVITTDAAGVQRNGLLRSFVTGKLYRTASVQGIRFQNAPACEDTVYNAMLVSNTADVRYAHTEVPLYYYYQGNMGSIVKTSTIDTYRLQAQWFLDHMHFFEKTDYAIGHAFKAVFLFRYTSFLYNVKTPYRKQSTLLLKKGEECLRRNRTISNSTRLIYRLFSLFPTLYRVQLCLRDSSYLIKEKERMKQKKKDL